MNKQELKAIEKKEHTESLMVDETAILVSKYVDMENHKGNLLGMALAFYTLGYERGIKKNNTKTKPSKRA